MALDLESLGRLASLASQLEAPGEEKENPRGECKLEESSPAGQSDDKRWAGLHPAWRGSALPPEVVRQVVRAVAEESEREEAHLAPEWEMAGELDFDLLSLYAVASTLENQLKVKAADSALEEAVSLEQLAALFAPQN